MTGTHPHGRSLPLGATAYPDGVNFSLFSKGCVGVELLLFGHGDDASPSRTISLNTAEGNQNGPTLCFKGLANDAYYILEPDKSRYANYTGTGNTLNANEPFVRRPHP
jgi:pullulanase/glycogen debranching enzyme